MSSPRFFFFVNYYIKFLQVAKKPSVPPKNTDFWKVDLNGSKWKTFEILGLVGLEHDFSRILRVDFSNGCQPKNRRFLPRKWMVKIMETLLKWDDFGVFPIFLETPK